jgi:ATP-dependent RNA helicase RhlE
MSDILPDNKKTSFRDFGLDTGIIEGIEAVGFEVPTPIQQQIIPQILCGNDVIGCAQTGTGKTAAYLLPILNNILHSRVDGVNTIIIAPTRELAVQIARQIEGFGYFLNISSLALYGGTSGMEWEQQKKALMQGVDIVVATPGKLISFLNMDLAPVKNLKHLVLDEADRMLDMGFVDDIIKIISYLPITRHTYLFSATMPPKIRELGRKILKNAVEINIALARPAEGILQIAYLTYDSQKTPLIESLIRGRDLSTILIFASTKIKVKNIARELLKLGYQVAEIHSDLEQNERENVLTQFSNRQLQILVATDVLSRGIDIENIDLVINYDVPKEAEDYVHRVGRTARAEKTGVAITFINEEEQQQFHRIEKLIDMQIRKLAPPAHLGEGPLFIPKVEKKRKFFKKRR